MRANIRLKVSKYMFPVEAISLGIFHLDRGNIGTGVPGDAYAALTYLQERMLSRVMRVAQ